MNTLKINIPEGFKVENFDEKTGEITFAPVPKDIKERLQTIQDVYAFHNYTEESFAAWCGGLAPHEIGRRKEELIVAAYNDNVLPDWTDGTWKYAPYFTMGSPSGAGFSYCDCVLWDSASDVGSRLVFIGPNAKANMLDATSKFIKEYQESRTL